MSWMNQWEVESAVLACRTHPVLGPATRFLMALMEAVNDQSDGWAYWSAPSHAAKALMELIQENMGYAFPKAGTTVTLKDVERTLTPIKRMVTVQTKLQKRYGNRFTFDVGAAWERAKSQTEVNT